MAIFHVHPLNKNMVLCADADTIDLFKSEGKKGYIVPRTEHIPMHMIIERRLVPPAMLPQQGRKKKSILAETPEDTQE